MRKRSAFFGGLLLLTLCLAAGCSGETAESVETVSEESASVGEITVENASFSESGEGGESVSETPAASESTETAFPIPAASQSMETAFQAPPASESEDEKVVLWSAPNGEIFSMDRDKDVSYGITFDKVLYRPSTGVFYEYSSDSEWFDRESGTFTGELIEFDESDFRCVKSGDQINGYTVEIAETTFYPEEKDEHFFDENGVLPTHAEIRFRDDVTLTGYLLYCAYDEVTAVSDGDFFMIPDASAKGFPRLNLFYWFHSQERIEAYPQKDKQEPWIGYYGDYYVIRLGNFYRDYAEREDLSALIGDRSESHAWRTSVTIENLSVYAAAVVSAEGCNGWIVRVGEPPQTGK